MNDMTPIREESGKAVAPARHLAVSEAVIQREIAEIQASMMMARKFPRDPVRALDRIIQACSRPSLAEVATYEYARGGSKINGPSIRLLEAIAQQWGNLSTGVKILSSDRGQGKSECVAYAVDLETGYRDEKHFTVRHWRDTRQGGYELNDERDIYELAANMGARRKRACILAVVPGDIVDEAVRQCEVTLKTTAEVTPDSLKAMVEKFEEFGVTRAQIEKKIQRRLDAMSSAQLTQMRRIYTSLKDGMSAASDWFDPEANEAAAEPPKPEKGVEGVKAAVRKRKPPTELPPDAEPARKEAPKKVDPGFEAITDEAVALRALDRCEEEGEAAAILERCEDQPFYPRVLHAFNEAFGGQE